MAATDLTLKRLRGEEGFRAKPYRDSVGKLTIGYGLNLDAGISQDLALVILAYQIKCVSDQMSKFAWFQGLDDVRASALLDLAFNMGLDGLLHFVQMLAAVGKRDWPTAEKELLSSKAALQLPDRYDTLGKILLTGEP